MTNIQNNNTAVIKAADGGIVHVELIHGGSLDHRYYEFDGYVQSPSQMKETSRASYGSTFGAPALPSRPTG